jgi:hypothetical protein
MRGYEPDKTDNADDRYNARRHEGGNEETSKTHLSYIDAHYRCVTIALYDDREIVEQGSRNE